MIQLQSEMYLYVADNVRIKKLRKDTGAHEKTYAHSEPLVTLLKQS